VTVETWHKIDNAVVEITLEDAADTLIQTAQGAKCVFKLPAPHLWDGVKDPYLYTATAQLFVDGKVTDKVATRFGIRSFYVDPKKGFILNGRPYGLHGVSRHQDRKGIGNAITRQMHEEDMALIKEMGCNTVRLAHYQHDQYFYDLCDENGMVVWAEIPYISEHMPNGRDNTISQMKELIIQNYNHPSIVCWGVSNEITISTKDKKDMLDNHRVLNDLCHEMDKTRFTTLACYAMCGPFNPVAHITDVVSWNLYLGWYVPGKFLNDLWVDFFHMVYPKRPLGYSEYGAEAMPNLHSSKPRRNDHTEEYQCIYHEYMLRFFEKRPWMWATHVWNMFDFAADARDQGGEPGMNHKGLVTFDRKLKKDSFYLYKAWWSDEPFVHICGKRYVDRPEKSTSVKVYSNQHKVSLYADGKLVAEKTGDKVFEFNVELNSENMTKLEAKSGKLSDTAQIRHVNSPNPSYKIGKAKQKNNWV
jgi:beta-galactosidase